MHTGILAILIALIVLCMMRVYEVMLHRAHDRIASLEAQLEESSDLDHNPPFNLTDLPGRRRS